MANKLVSGVIKKPTIKAIASTPVRDTAPASTAVSPLSSLLNKTTTPNITQTIIGPTPPLVNPQIALREEKEEPASSAIDTSAYDRMIAAYEAKMRADAEAAKTAKAAEYDAQAKSAYIARLQNERTLSDNLARAGIRGGTSETTAARLLSNYENNRNQIEANKSSALTGIDKDASDKIFEYTQTQEAAKLAYIQAREAEARQIAETQRQEQWTASQNALERAYNSDEAEKTRQFTASQNQAQWAHDDERSDLDYYRTIEQNKAAQDKADRDAKQKDTFAVYVATIGKLDTIDKCEAELKSLKSKYKKGTLTATEYAKRKWEVEAQMAVVRAAAKKK